MNHINYKSIYRIATLKADVLHDMCK